MASQHQNNTARITAVLGPTNTGKTHFAIERMLAHRTGMIGLPLRLLAREVYDKIILQKGPEACALITGEEKIVPAGARYFVCTVEAMPLDLGVSFLAIDEIQLCADQERGHVFTDRLLHARGEDETIFLGSDTMRGMIQRFVPRTYFISRARFSDLAYTGAKKLTRLPRRSAIVGFSADDVYGIADLIRRQRGGAAVVLGALSPRTRNAQVALYQSGEVDFLVATDAIGMGLNMDVDHVAFSALEKFDGLGHRPLRPDELGQIAGRAGRYMNDGTFGVTAEAEPLDDDIVSRIESHRYDPIRTLQWRNSHLNFQSLDALLASLDEPPPLRGLSRARPASDVVALRSLSAQEDVRAVAGNRDAVRELWEVCQLPDFRKLAPDDHVRLVQNIYLYLMGDDGVLPSDWLARQVSRLDIIEGDVATLSGRLAQIRTWTYAANRPGWVKDAGYWQGETRRIEDRLSDALHESLTQRFIDRRTSVLMKHLREDELVELSLDDAGGVSIRGEAIGKLEGFHFQPDPRAQGIHGRTLRTAAMKGLEGELRARTQRLSAADDKEISLSEHGKFWWDGAVIARLTPGPSPLSPQIELVTDETFRNGLRDAVQNRLGNWLKARMDLRLEPLLALARATDAKAGTTGALPAAARGIAHQLVENFGSLDRSKITVPGDDVRPLIRALRPFGVWVGRRRIYLPKLVRPEAANLLALLWGVWSRTATIPAPPLPGLTSFECETDQNQDFLSAAGYHVLGQRAIRFDILERLEEELVKGAQAGVNTESLQLKIVSMLGSSNDEAKAVLKALGWQNVSVADSGQNVLRRKTEKARAPKQRKKVEASTPISSPFAELAKLSLKR